MSQDGRSFLHLFFFFFCNRGAVVEAPHLVAAAIWRDAIANFCLSDFHYRTMAMGHQEPANQHVRVPELRMIDRSADELKY